MTTEETVEPPVGFANPDYTYNPVPDPVDPEMPTDGLHPMEVPRHDRYASENSGVVAERVIPYTATAANPSYPQDAEPGFEAAPEVSEPAVEEPVVEPEPEPVVEPDAPVEAEPAPTGKHTKPSESE